MYKSIVKIGRAATALWILSSWAAHAADVSGASTQQLQTGIKYSALRQINATNVANLELAWVYHTGDTKVVPKSLTAFEDEPSIISGSLIVCSTSRKVIALDPATGKQRWVYDPGNEGTMRKCRGIASWKDADAADGTICKTRIFLGTTDYRLVAIDAATGKSCPDFGDHGVVKMPISKPELFPGEVSAASRPAVVNGVVVVGSTVADDQRIDAPSGRVLAYDARTGQPRWQFDPIPRSASDPAMKTWLTGTDGHGAANVWAEMSVDESLDLVYLPTTSPSVDFWGGTRPGNNRYADSLVALKGSTGEVAWSFQFTHHNIWDYDTPAQPLLVDLPYNGKIIAAVVQINKTGLIFIFDRKTGEPLLPFVERAVPQQGAVKDEWLSPTQPFPVGMPALAPQSISPDDAWGFTLFDRLKCQHRIEELQHGSIYTPPSLKGTILQPSPGGGPNWGGGAFDPMTNIMVVPSNRVPLSVTLIPRQGVTINADQAIETGGPMTFPSQGSPYVTRIEPLLSPFGAPCTKPPWATLTAVDLASGAVLWEVPLGSIDKLAHLPFSWELGTPGAGGPLVTAGGLAFIGYTLDSRLRAFDLKTGKTLWKTDLPAPGNSVPVSYEVNGEQYIVIPAGGHSLYGTPISDAVLAYKLKH
jgi:quinoprotein glucose dehydrogenase